MPARENRVDRLPWQKRKAAGLSPQRDEITESAVHAGRGRGLGEGGRHDFNSFRSSRYRDQLEYLIEDRVFTYPFSFRFVG